MTKFFKSSMSLILYSVLSLGYADLANARIVNYSGQIEVNIDLSVPVSTNIARKFLNTTTEQLVTTIEGSATLQGYGSDVLPRTPTTVRIQIENAIGEKTLNAVIERCVSVLQDRSKLAGLRFTLYESSVLGSTADYEGQMVMPLNIKASSKGVFQCATKGK